MHQLSRAIYRELAPLIREDDPTVPPRHARQSSRRARPQPIGSSPTATTSRTRHGGSSRRCAHTSRSISRPRPSRRFGPTCAPSSAGSTRTLRPHLPAATCSAARSRAGAHRANDLVFRATGTARRISTSRRPTNSQRSPPNRQATAPGTGPRGSGTTRHMAEASLGGSASASRESFLGRDFGPALPVSAPVSGAVAGTPDASPQIGRASSGRPLCAPRRVECT